VPWCEQCAKFWNPSSMTAEGACPSCGRTLERAAASAPTPAGEEPTLAPLTGANLREMAGEDAKAPWHFKLMVAALAVYLGWRVVDLVLAAFR
jgi:hypothetical protein